MQLPPVPPVIHPVEAAAYVRDHFATHDYGTPAVIIGFECAHRGAVDVLFTGAGSPSVARFTVWNEPREDGTFYAYGEW